MTIEFTEEYPNKAPLVKFITKMYHPNSECFLPSAGLTTPDFNAP